MTRPRVLVIGAGGCLGGAVRRALDRSDALMPVLASRTRPAGAPTAWTPFDAATSDRRAFADLLDAKRPDAIVNAAGATEGDPARLVRGNVTLVAELLAAIERTAPGIRYVQLGSAAEYGAVTPGIPIDEACPPNPVGAYGIAKLAGTELALGAARAGVADAIVLRVFNLVGPGVSPATLAGRSIELIARAQARGDASVTFGPLHATRDFVDVDDVGDAVVAALTAKALPHEERLVNVASGVATSARELVELVVEVAGYEGSIVEEAAGSERSAGVDWHCADVRRAADRLGWRATRDLRGSVERAWARAGAPAV